MTLEIRGLSCAACKKDIPADGVTCAACTAPHHWPCYAGAGCATCQSAKPPVPFCVAPRAGAPWVGWAAAAGVVAALTLGGASLGLVYVAAQKQQPAQVVSAPPAALVPPAPPNVPPPPAPPQFMPPPPPQQFQAASTGTRLQVRAQAGQARTVVKTRERRIDVRATRHPGRLQGYLQDAQLSDGTGDQLELTLGEPVRALFLSAEVRPGALPGPMVLRVEGQAKDAKDGWTTLGSFPVPPSGRRWYRLDGGKPFDTVRLKLEGSGATLSFSSFAGLLEKPAGEVIEASRAATVKSVDASDVVLASSKGATVKLPRSVLPARGNDGAVSLASPDGGVILRMPRDGNVSVFDARSSGLRSFGMHVLSMHGQSSVRDDAANTWIDGIGVWALLDRWHPAAARDAAFSPALETTVVLHEDGSLALYRPNMTSPMQTEIDSLDELENVLAAVDQPAGDESWTADRHRASMRLGQMGLAARRGEALSRSQRELVRFMKEEVVPRFRKLVGPARPIAAGDRCAFAWRSNVFNYAKTNGLHVTMLDRDLVVVRPSERGMSGAEIELPRDFLPAAPAPRVGQTLYLDWDTTR